MLNELESDINKLIDKWIKEKTEGYLFRDDDTYNVVMAIVDELEETIGELLSDAEKSIDYELENAELKNGYWVERPTIEDGERLRYENLM